MLCVAANVMINEHAKVVTSHNCFPPIVDSIPCLLPINLP